MRIAVTQEDIGKAQELHGTDLEAKTCPVAQALVRICGTHLLPTFWFVGMTVVKWGDKYYTLPPTARAFVVLYDKKWEIAPFEFELPGFEC